WMMLQPDEPRDYVVATGESRSVRDFLDAAFSMIDVKDWTPFVRIDPRFFRPAEVDVLRGDASRIERDLGWRPGTPFEEWVRRMVRHDIEEIG
ncbi:MAG: GDP-mannose 4,6-dehydratase, partial [Gammaproteobacteria bacterium]|nr:GDP-mannose 4,6-dehydratase [Gammaproteobacteria bacterium]